jgi:arginine/lysine/ornithine decarboxylase
MTTFRICLVQHEQRTDASFDRLGHQMLFFYRDHKNIALPGDFNSRTSNVSDIVELDDNLFDMLDISNVPEYFYN